MSAQFPSPPQAKDATWNHTTTKISKLTLTWGSRRCRLQRGWAGCVGWRGRWGAKEVGVDFRVGKGGRKASHSPDGRNRSYLAAHQDP